MLGHFDEALVCFDKVLELNPEDIVAFHQKAKSLSSQGRFNEALCFFDKLLRAEPKNDAALEGKGFCLHNLNLNRFDEAISCYDRALEIDPRRAGPWVNKGLAEDRLGRKEDSIRSYKQFISLKPTQYAAEMENVRRRLEELGELISE